MADGPGYGTVDQEYGMKLATTAPEDDGPVWMINLMHYKERADYGDGNDQGKSGREADNEYTPIGPLTAIGAEIVFAAEVEDQLLGDSPKWDRVAIVKYPTRRSFVEMQSREDFQKQHVHKQAGMAETVVMGGLPMPRPAVPESNWDEVPHPPTDEDGPVVVCHVVQFEDTPERTSADVTPEHMEEYQRHAGVSASKHGVRIPAWFSVEGTIIGDGRPWHQVRFNAFPSKRAFMDVVMDPERLEAQKEHREVAMSDTYTMILRPMIDRLAESVDAG